MGARQRAVRYWVTRVVVAVLTRAWLAIRLEGGERLPKGPAIYAFNHLSWADPFVLGAVLPMRPRLSFFGPREEDMGRGARNRLMTWSGTTIPYKPGKNDLLDTTRRVGAVIASGSVVAIAAEGRIGPVEGALLPLQEGAAYFALRSRVPLVPVAISGTSWLPFRGRVRVRVGEPIATVDVRADRAGLAATTEALAGALRAMIADAPEASPPGRIGRWMSDVFNDWPEGSRDAALAAWRSSGSATPDGPSGEHESQAGAAAGEGA